MREADLGDKNEFQASCFNVFLCVAADYKSGADLETMDLVAALENEQIRQNQLVRIFARVCGLPLSSSEPVCLSERENTRGSDLHICIRVRVCGVPLSSFAPVCLRERDKTRGSNAYVRMRMRVCGLLVSSASVCLSEREKTRGSDVYVCILVQVCTCL